MIAIDPASGAVRVISTLDGDFNFAMPEHNSERFTLAPDGQSFLRNDRAPPLGPLDPRGLRAAWRPLQLASPVTIADSRTPTELLVAWSHGETGAFDVVLALVHEELRRLARGYMARERPGHTLQATALVNEAYLRLIDVRACSWQNRAHFFAMSARLMRRILVDVARARGKPKRGGGAPTVTLDEALVVSDGRRARTSSRSTMRWRR